jgi:hypothetical protein
MEENETQVGGTGRFPLIAVEGRYRPIETTELLVSAER